MCSKLHENEKVIIKYSLDESAKATAKKLEIRNFRESVTKSAQILQIHKSDYKIKKR